MKEEITIDGTKYMMKSSAYTQFAYKNMTGRSLLTDLQQMINLVDKVEDDLALLDKITEPVLDISYVMILEADENQVKSKEDFYKSIESLYDNFDWVIQVITLASKPISRQLFNKINQS